MNKTFRIIKWSATALIIFAVASRSAGLDPMLDFVPSIIGTTIWGWIGWKNNDRALLTLNAVILTMLVSGLLRLIGAS